MSKELTEQWQQGKLKDGFYFVKEDDEIFISICSNHYLLNVLKDCEVLAPVPTYEEFFEDKKFMKDLGRDYSELMNQKVELLEKIKQIEELFRYALFSDSDGHYKPCKNTTKQEAYNILGRIQEILGTNKQNGIYGREPDRV